VTRLAIVSDTHLPRGARRLPDRCVELMRAADVILHAGDLSTSAVLAELRALGPPVHAVLGNVDEPALAGELPAEATLQAGGARIAMLHDSGPAAGRMARMHRRFPDADAVVFGHSHIPLHETGPGGLQLFNPGSPTDRRRQPRHTMGVAEVGGGAVRFELVVLD
jgi:putative phosphoesterase